MKAEKGPSSNPEAEIKPKGEGGRFVMGNVSEELFNSQENKGIFSRLKEGGKKMIGGIYEKINKIDIVGKIRIAFNERLMKYHEGKVGKIKEDIAGIDLEINSLVKTEEKTKELADKMRKMGMPGVESLEADLGKIGLDIAEAKGKRKGKETKLKEKNDKTESLGNKKDMIADRLIGKYDKKIQPMEKEIGKLQQYREERDFLISATEKKHKRQLKELDDSERNFEEIKQEFESLGRPMPKGLKKVEENIAKGRKKIEEERAALAEKRRALEEKIRKLEDKANGKKTKRQEFENLKDRRKARKIETTRADQDQSTGEESPDFEMATETPVSQEKEPLINIVEGIKDWNEHLEEWNVFDRDRKKIDSKEFLKLSGYGQGEKIEPEDLGDLIDKYYKLKKITFANIAEKLKRAFINKEKNKE